MVELVNCKDFYVDTHYLCGFRSSENIFDLPKEIFDCGDFICFESAVKKYVSDKPVTMHMWPWLWDTSKSTDEVYIYDIQSSRIIYHTSDTSDFYDARLVRKEETLHGCEIFDYKFQFPKMITWLKKE